MIIERLGNYFAPKNIYFSANNNILKNHKDNTRLDTFAKSNSFESFQKVSFRGHPYNLNYPHSDNMSAQEALNLFEKLRLGNYLDINGNPNNYYDKKIRQNNLDFLNKVKNLSEMNKFITYYKDITGFPNLDIVSSRIQSEFLNAVKKSEHNLNRSYNYPLDIVNVVVAGYDGVSSTAKGYALPGSDLDKAYVILAGSTNDAYNENLVNDFKGELWRNTDQRILSYNHDAVSFPEVYTIKQYKDLVNKINQKLRQMHLRDYSLWGIISRHDKYHSYKYATDNFNTDYVRANRFLVDLCERFPLNGNWNKKLNLENPSREDIYKVAFIIEAINHGKKLYGNEFEQNISNDLVQLLNVSQIRALKNSNAKKPKYIRRKQLEQEFNQWDISKQYDFIKSLIKASCCANEKEEFPEYFASQEVSKFRALLDKLNLEVKDV